MSMADGALSAKAKAMYGRRLTEKDYLELLKKRSVSEVVAYLKNETVYQKWLKDVHDNTVHRGQLEKLLRRNMFDQLQRLHRYCGRKQEAFYKTALKQMESNVILDRIRAIQAQNFSSSIADMPLYLDAFTEVPLKELIRVRTYRELLSVLQGTMYYDVLQRYDPANGNMDYTSLETDLQKLYFEHVFHTINKLFHGRIKKDLCMIFATTVELSNITKLYRYKEFYPEDMEDVRHALIPYQSRLSDRILADMIAAPDVKALLSILEKSPYKLFADDKDYVYIEYYAERIKYCAAKRFLCFSTAAPLVFSAYQQLLELEVNNLITIIEGVRYQMPSDDIQSMLIY